MMATLLLGAYAYNNGAPHSRLPPLGWSSWVALGPGAKHPIFDYCDETNVKHAIDAFHAVGLYDAGYRHFHLDDCWAGGRNESGFLYPERDHFPRGMAPVVDYAHSRGLSFGLYTCAGTQTCVGGRPGSKGHWKQDASVFAECMLPRLELGTLANLVLLSPDFDLPCEQWSRAYAWGFWTRVVM